MIDPSEFCAHHGDAYAFELGGEYRCAACTVERVAELERILQRKTTKAEAAGYRGMWRKAVARIAELEYALAGERERMRTTAQILIEAVGADGPMDAESAARRAVARVLELEEENIRLAGLVYERDPDRLRAEKAESERDSFRAEVARLRSLIPPTFDEKCDALRAAVAEKE